MSQNQSLFSLLTLLSTFCQAERKSGYLRDTQANAFLNRGYNTLRTLFSELASLCFCRIISPINRNKKLKCKDLTLLLSHHCYLVEVNLESMSIQWICFFQFSIFNCKWAIMKILDQRGIFEQEEISLFEQF